MTSPQMVVRCHCPAAWLAFAVAIVTPAIAPAAVLYTVTDLGVPPGEYDRTFVRSVNDSGQMAGYSDLSTGAKVLGWRYHGDIGFDELSSENIIPYSINLAGQVAGDFVGARSFRWTEAGGMVTLPTLPGGSSHAYAMNDGGQVAGSSSMTGSTFQRVVRWSAANTIEDLGLPAGRDIGVGRAINNSGQLAVSAADSFGDSRGYLYTDGFGFRDLGSLGGRVEAWGINDAVQVVGSSRLLGGPPNVTHAFVWSDTAGMQDIGALPGIGYAQAHAINNLGLIVGESLVAENAFHAFLHRDGMMHDLNNLIDPAQGWTLQVAWDVSDRGFIVGWGRHNGAARSFLLRPVPEPNSLILWALVGAVTGFPVVVRADRKTVQYASHLYASNVDALA